MGLLGTRQKAVPVSPFERLAAAALPKPIAVPSSPPPAATNSPQTATTTAKVRIEIPVGAPAAAVGEAGSPQAPPRKRSCSCKRRQTIPLATVAEGSETGSPTADAKAKAEFDDELAKFEAITIDNEAEEIALLQLAAEQFLSTASWSAS